jgi:D-alanine-D-alanine ligase-like ATP-grasp enzyme
LEFQGENGSRASAIEVAYMEDNEIIIESFLDGTEVSVGVINYKGTTVLPITEIVSENEFFDYEAKYLENPKKSHRHEFLMK